MNIILYGTCNANHGVAVLGSWNSRKNESPRSEGVSAGTGEGVVVDAVLGLAFDFPPSPESGLRKTGLTSRTQFVGRARGFYK